MRCCYNWIRSTCQALASQVALVVKNLLADPGDARDSGLIPGSGRSPGVSNGNTLQYSCLKNPMDRGAWRAAVHGVAKSQTWLSNWTHTVWTKRDSLLVQEVPGDQRNLADGDSSRLRTNSVFAHFSFKMITIFPGTPLCFDGHEKEDNGTYQGVKKNRHTHHLALCLNFQIPDIHHFMIRSLRKSTDNYFYSCVPMTISFLSAHN